MSTLTAIPLVADRSEMTTGFFNVRLSIISDNISVAAGEVQPMTLRSGDTFSMLSHVTVGGRVSVKERLHVGAAPSDSTLAQVVIGVSSAQSDYVLFADSSGAQSDFLLSSRVGPSGVDGLKLWDVSGATMLINFSKQSVRFFQNVVGPVFDTGGALADTYNAATFIGSGSTLSGIQAAINQASIDGVTRVYLPASMYPYSASSISFIYPVQMVREGGNWGVYDVRAYGASGDIVTDDLSAFLETINAASARSGRPGTVVFSGGTFSLSSGITMRSRVVLVGDAVSSVLSPAANRDAIFGSAVTDILISGVVIAGRGGADAGNGMQFSGCSDIIVQQCRIRNIGQSGAGIIFASCDRVQANNNLGLDCGYAFVNIFRTTGFLVSGNNHQNSRGSADPRTCVYVNAGASPCRDGIVSNNVSDSDSHPFQVRINVERVAVIGNSVRSGLVSGILVQADSSNSAKNVTIIGNTVHMQAGSSSGINVDGAQYVTVGQNTIFGPVGTAGIHINLTGAGPAADEVSIVGNSIRSTAANGYGILFGPAGAARCQIVGNNVDETTVQTGIAVEGTGIIVANNSVRRAGFRGIDISATSSVVLGNLIDTTAGGGEGIRATGADCLVSNNVVTAPSGAAYSVTGARSVLFQNNAGIWETSSSTIRIAEAPTGGGLSGTAAGTAGDIAWGSSSGVSFLYVCVSANSWMRATLNSF